MSAMRQVTVLKVGGAVVEDSASLSRFLNGLRELPGHKVLVHGGGRTASALAKELAVPVTMIDGRRVTDSEMLRIVTMVYGGLVNKNIVATLSALGVKAIGLTGADMDVIKAHRRESQPLDFGFVGDVDHVDAQALGQLLSMGLVPVIAPLTLGQGTLLNTNADTVAAAVATAMAKAGWQTTLTYCFEMPGVLRRADDPSSVIPCITGADFEALVAQGTVSGGMIPKIQNALHSIKNGVHAVTITSWQNAGNPQAGTHIL